jgi:hypothetical protein
MKKLITASLKTITAFTAISLFLMALTANAESIPNEPGQSAPNQFLDMDNTMVNVANNAGAQYNPTIAINYQNPANAVIVWQDTALAYPRIGFAYTHNGGQAWTDALLNLPSYASQSEPSIAADSNGNFFLCMIAGDTSSQAVSSIIILKSTDGGSDWSQPIIAVFGGSEYHDIMPKMTVDNTPFGSRGFIYVTWVRYADDISSSLVYSTLSDNGGQSFYPPVQVSDDPGIVRWPNVSIRSAFDNGDVDVCWYRSHYPGILFDHSVTESWTFGHDYWPTVTGADNDEINGGIFVSTTPFMAGDNQHQSSGFGKSYVIYMDSSYSNWDIFCMRITSFFNNAEYIDFSWPIRVNDDPPGNSIDQFMPTIAVDETGNIHVAFFDRRNDSGNLYYDVYYTSSADSGNNWTPNLRVSNISSDPTLPGVTGQIGNRIGIAAWSGHVMITWTDTRNGNTDIYASRLMETGISEEPAPIPGDIGLDKLYPNPFNGSVQIEYSSKSTREVKVEIIDLLGRQVVELFNGVCRTGSNTLIWDGKTSDNQTAGSGIYFVRLIGDGQTHLKKAILLK